MESLNPLGNAQNSLKKSTTGLTPFQCILGYQPPLFPWTGEPSVIPAIDHCFFAKAKGFGIQHIFIFSEMYTNIKVRLMSEDLHNLQ